ncbi:hypothetical protein [Polaribacter sp. R77954]|uniref:hypothetical protein n=1 Tax=Polaribacter sp. R77954 TaxID=3093870 RepID=UPI0037C6D2F0
MTNNTIILLAVILCCSLPSFGQQNEFNLIKLDSTWGQEVLRFPARNMDYIGVGEVRFPPKGWIKPNHPNFWSYTYAWSINVNRKIKAKELTIDLIKYFNSLNKVDMDDVANLKQTTAAIIKVKRNRKTTYFEGKVTIFDRFATNKSLTLNVKIKSNFCKKAQKTVLLFAFSPKEFTHKVWETLNKIELINEVCIQ